MATRFWEASAGRAFVARLATRSDLVDEIERHCAEHGVTAAQVTVIGAVRTGPAHRRCHVGQPSGAGDPTLGCTAAPAFET